MLDMFSVIVPVYKVEKYLDRCIESLVNQTYSNLEIILVDDGSPDHCPQICDNWALRDSRIKVVHKQNGGLSSARNKALDIAVGDYYCFVDSDDWIAPDLCEKVLTLFKEHDVGIVNFDCCRVTEDGKMLGGTETVQDRVLSQEEALVALMQGKINNYMCNKVFKRFVFDDVRFPEGRLWEDMAICYKLLLKAEHIYCSSEKLYYYLQRYNSITATISEKALCDVFIARYNSFLSLKDIYPQVGELVFPKVALCAVRLFDRSLWADVDQAVLVQAQGFLKENKDKILKEIGGGGYQLYYRFPGLYAFFRVCKHKIGNLVRCVRKK